MSNNSYVSTGPRSDIDNATETRRLWLTQNPRDEDFCQQMAAEDRGCPFNFGRQEIVCFPVSWQRTSRALRLRSTLSLFRMITIPNPKLILMMVLNFIGIGAYLAFASCDWVEPEVRDIPGASVGGPIIWGFAALPTLVMFFLLDLVWLGWGCAAYIFKKKTWMLHPFFWLVPAIWAFAIYIDLSQHGIE